ncbi:MAG: hypothetical protein LBQ21_01195, partial [Clostridiales Family XIII bacterium]|nr:hypothetical protein [Clostridiales Family XIII bacterium]
EQNPDETDADDSKTGVIARKPAKEDASGEESSLPLPAIIALCGAILLAILFGIWWFLFAARRRRKKEEEENDMAVRTSR